MRVINPVEGLFCLRFSNNFSLLLVNNEMPCQQTGEFVNLALL